MSGIGARIEAVRAELADAARLAGRAPSEVRLVAVSKHQPVSAIVEAYEAGQRDFGENYGNELRDKRAALAQLTDIRWHYIGRIQSNKAGWLAAVHRVHALESVRHASALLARSPAGVDALLYVDVAGEPTKGGVAIPDVVACAQALSGLDGLRLRGLMCLPPAVAHPADAGAYFAATAELLAACRANGVGMDELSMGMSADAAVAVAHGATWVRVGRAIFGDRPA